MIYIYFPPLCSTMFSIIFRLTASLTTLNICQTKLYRQQLYQRSSQKIVLHLFVFSTVKLLKLFHKHQFTFCTFPHQDIYLSRQFYNFDFYSKVLFYFFNPISKIVHFSDFFSNKLETLNVVNSRSKCNCK